MNTLTLSDGPISASEAEQWTKAAIPYANRAGDKGVAERALKAAQAAVRDWSERVLPLHKRWRHTFYMLSGNTLDNVGPADIHIPEMHKILETAVPRVVEALLDRDPWFRVLGRRSIKTKEAETIAAYLDWQIDQDKFVDKVEPAVRNMLVTQVAAFHICWERRLKRRFRREYKQIDSKDGKARYAVNGEWREEVDYDGPATRLVDPFDFIMDPSSTDPQMASYVGYRALVSLDEIERYGKMFGWENLTVIREATESGHLTPDYGQINRWSRDPSTRYSSDQKRKHLDHQPGKFEVVSLWMKADILEEGVFEEVEIVVVNGSTVAVARQNIMDGQFRPFAIARASNNGHHLFGVGPFDNAVRLNQQLDRYMAIVYRAAELSAMPFGFTGEDGELPDSLYRTRPGQLFKGVKDITFSSVPEGFTRSAPLVVGSLTRHIEETTGVYKIQMGQADAAGTATEATLSLQEGNRRMRAWIRAVAGMFKQTLDIFHRLNQQFTCAKTPFRVLGKRAAALGTEYVEIGPDSMLTDVDFEMVGLKSLSTNGLQQVGLQALINIGAPFMQANPDLVNVGPLLHDAAKLLVGREEADRYIRVPPDPDNMVPQEQENVILLSGGEVEVHEMDDDEDHMVRMRDLVAQAEDEDSGMDARVVENVLKHHLEHALARKRKAAKRHAAEERQQLVSTMMQQQTGTAPQPGGFMTQPGQKAGSMPGQNPGPMDVRKAPRTAGTARMHSQAEAAQG